MGVFDTNCEGHQLLEKIANKWTILIIYALTQGKKRYSELKQQIVDISPQSRAIGVDPARSIPHRSTPS